MRDNVCYAGFAVRFFAWLTDALVMAVPLSILRAIKLFADPYGFLARPILFAYSPLDAAVWLLPVVYCVAMTYSQGATLGKMLRKLEVVGADGSLSLWQVLLRELFGRYLSVTLLCIGYFMAIPDAEKRALHDRIADTRVVYAVRPGRGKAVGGAGAEFPESGR